MKRRSRSHLRAAERITDDEARKFSQALRRWFRRAARDLPWRKTRDPYAILVSELMLQQTQVSRVIDYYGRFLDRFPSLAHVARARPAHVMEAWEGLGYYARARNLHRLATEVTEGGRNPTAALPTAADDLRKLPGIGAYTAGAVSSFAYERRAPLVDTNVARVLGRVFAPKTSIRTTAGQKKIWAIAERVLPRSGRTGWMHNQALMELGALVCTARVANCGVCPITSQCRSSSVQIGRHEKRKQIPPLVAALTRSRLAHDGDRRAGRREGPAERGQRTPRG
jgi:A/G-specific adenine glycosylase